MSRAEYLGLVIAELAAAWAKHPELRFGQLLVNIVRRPETGLGSLFYIEDAALFEAVRAFNGQPVGEPHGPLFVSHGPLCECEQCTHGGPTRHPQHVTRKG